MLVCVSVYGVCVHVSICVLHLLCYTDTVHTYTIHPTGYSYERLDGSVRGEERFLAVKNFTEDEDIFIFLLSTKAGKIIFSVLDNIKVLYFTQSLTNYSFQFYDGVI